MRFELFFPESVHPGPITGRIFLIATRSEKSEPRLQLFDVPFFAADVKGLKAGEIAVIDVATPGFPIRSLAELPPGDYYVQGLLNIYTEFHRSDGHIIWAHMDQWEGQDVARSPGNLISGVKTVNFDPQCGCKLKLELNKTIPPIEVPPDTEWVKRIKFQSQLLSRFWGQPIYLGATILLPRGYNAHPKLHYPVVYVQGHFSHDAPFGFKTEPDPPETKSWARRREEWNGRRLNMLEPPLDVDFNGSQYNVESGYEFYQSWISDDFPRVIAVTFQHPTPYFDDSYGINSANAGPYGDALMGELIPAVEERVRVIRQPYARVLTGCSTGGWASLALQAYYPDFFGGAWIFCPDPVDFRRYYGGVNLYECVCGVNGQRMVLSGTPLLPQPHGPSAIQQSRVQPSDIDDRTTGPRLCLGELYAGRKRWLPKAGVGPRHRPNRPGGGRLHEGARLRSARVPGTEVVANRPAIGWQAVPVLRR